jgi:hypothetical protein
MWSSTDADRCGSIRAGDSVFAEHKTRMTYLINAGIHGAEAP